MTDEATVWEGGPSQITNLGTYILCGIAALTVVLLPIAAPVALWKYLVVKNTRFELTTQRLKYRRGVLSRKVDEIELYRVKDTRFEQTFWQRMAGVGDVVLLSSDMTQSLQVLKSIPDAENVREKVRGLVEARRAERGVRMVERE